MGCGRDYGCIRTGRALGTAEETHDFFVEGLETMLTKFVEIKVGVEIARYF